MDQLLTPVIDPWPWLYGFSPNIGWRVRDGWLIHDYPATTMAPTDYEPAKPFDSFAINTTTLWAQPPAPSPEEPPRGQFSPLVEEREDGQVVRTGDVTAAMAAFWSKSSCRRCNGKGTLSWSRSDGHERVEACSCVLRNLSRR